MKEVWYKVELVMGSTYKWKVVEYQGTKNIYSYNTLRYFKTQEQAERFIKKLKKVKL